MFEFLTKCKTSIVFISFVFMCSITLYSQTYANKKHYLIDSLNLGELSAKDKKIIDSALLIYHKAIHDTLKISAINMIMDEAYDDNVWISYNKYMYEYTQVKLSNQLLATNTKVKLRLLK